ncbi:MAG: hypothetical protein ACNA8W_05745 [Bradymonadaceae bacterium]
MNEHRRISRTRGFSFAVMASLIMLFSPSFAGANDNVRVALTEIPYGGDSLLVEELNKLDGVDLRESAWFYNQVQTRGFSIDGVEDRPNDLRWVMSGGSIDWVINIVLTDDMEAYEARFIAAETATPKHTLSLDLGEDGLTRAGAQLVRMEFEKIIGGAPAAAPVARIDEPEGEAGPVEAADSEVLRQRAAAERAALGDAFSKEWLWIKAHGRLLRKDFFVAGQNAIFSYTSGGFPGFDLDIEAFPFALSNPDMAAAGIYLHYIQGFDSLKLITTGDDGSDEEAILSLGHISFEGGAIFRLDSPLDKSIQQTRFKLGVRYEGFSVTENPLIPSTSLVSLVLGTRLVMPVFIDEFAVTANLDIMPMAFFGDSAELFGEDSFSYGFGTELGILYQMTSGLFVSAAYGFRLNRTDFTGTGKTDDGPSEFSNSDAFDLFQGLKAGIVYRY